MSIHYISAQRLLRETWSGQLPDLYDYPGQTSRPLRSVRVLVLTVTSRVKTWSKSITRRPHGAVASLLVNPDTHGLSQKWDFPQLPKHRVVVWFL